MRAAQFIGGVACLLIGAFLIGEYVWQAVIERWGMADQSLLFWLSVLPMLGIPLAVFGAGMVVRSVRGRSGMGAKR